MSREIIEVCFEKQAKFVDVLCGKEVGFLMLNLMVGVWRKHRSLKD
jgi:hypothetical protein